MSLAIHNTLWLVSAECAALIVSTAVIMSVIQHLNASRILENDAFFQLKSCKVSGYCGLEFDFRPFSPIVYRLSHVSEHSSLLSSTVTVSKK